MEEHISDGFFVAVVVNAGFFIYAKTYLDLRCLSAMRALSLCTSLCLAQHIRPTQLQCTFIFKLFLSNPLCSCHTEHMLMQTASKKLEMMCNSTSLSMQSLLSHAGLYQSSWLWVFSSQRASAAGASEKHFAVCALCFLTGMVYGHP